VHLFVVLLAIVGINSLHFLIPKEFSRRRIRHLAIGLGSWQLASHLKNDGVSSSGYGASAISGL
jgi:hypothetical protein